MSRIAIFVLATVACAAMIPARPASAHDRNSILRASNQAYDNGNYLRSARLLVELTESGWGGPTYSFNAACGFALGGKPDSAFVMLEDALGRGLSDPQLVGEDSDLESLRDDPRWAAIVSRCEANARGWERTWDNAVWKGEYRETLTDTERVAGLSRLWSVAKYNFVNFDRVPDVDWDRAYFEYLPRVLATESTRDYYRELVRMCAMLEDGHTYVTPPRELRDQLWSEPTIRTRRIEGRVVVVEAYAEALNEEGIRVGDVLVAIDGTPVEEYATENVRPYQFASTPQDLERKVYGTRLLRGARGSTVSLTLERADGSTYEARIERFFGSDFGDRVPQRPFSETRQLDGGIYYIALNTFNQPEVVDEFRAAFDEIAKSRALVIDLRNNGGGNSAHGWRIIAMLTRERFPVARWYTREYRPTSRAWKRPESRYDAPIGTQGAGERSFDGPVAVLISGRTYSAAEDFCVTWRGMDRGPLVGEPTGGSTGQPLFLTIPGGIGVAVCTKRNLMLDGSEFVGIGIAPDIEVRATIADIRAGRDPVLDAAVAALERTLAE